MKLSQLLCPLYLCHDAICPAAASHWVSLALNATMLSAERLSDQFGSIFSRRWLRLGMYRIPPHTHTNARLDHQTPSSPTGTPRHTPNGSSCLSPSNPTTRTICLDLKSDHINPTIQRVRAPVCVHSVKYKLPSLADKALYRTGSLFALMPLWSTLSALYFIL